MTTTELKARIQKKEEQIEKKFKTIEKKTKLIEKKQAEVDKIEDERERYWKSCDITHLKEDIERLHKQIEECKETLEKYNKQLAGEEEREASYIKEVPELLKKMEADLVERWNRYDIQYREHLKRRYQELEYREFHRIFGHQGYEFMYKTDEEIDKNNKRDARLLVLDLVNRVKNITGEITDWSNIRAEAGNDGFTVLAGYVEGKEGTAEVQTIFAGGYNIQRLHVRTLVHARA